DTPREGLVLNVAELRLYYYPKPKAGEPPVVKTFPVSIGRMDWKTPLGTTQVVAKVKDPAWYPPASIKREHAERGDILPDVVPPGPDNPLGQHAMRLGIPGYLIHGTNRPSGIGMRVTHGCVRMYPEDIASLFPEVPKGTRVTIVNQPMKSGWLADSLFVEYHDPLDEDNNAYKVSLDEAVAAVVNKAGPFAERIQPDAIAAVVARGSGMPVPVTLDRHTVPVDRRPSPMDDRRQSVELIDLYSRPY
ncbi:MAG: L,D-transpeptidase family protein, partial [Candidatus Competibacteraceae bacterium]|nr:L,D-transpeptidase family protein [Candidatus Competibacteraceae bacterium]